LQGQKIGAPHCTISKDFEDIRSYVILLTLLGRNLNES